MDRFDMPKLAGGAPVQAAILHRVDAADACHWCVRLRRVVAWMKISASRSKTFLMAAVDRLTPKRLNIPNHFPETAYENVNPCGVGCTALSVSVFNWFLLLSQSGNIPEHPVGDLGLFAVTCYFCQPTRSRMTHQRGCLGFGVQA